MISGPAATTSAPVHDPVFGGALSGAVGKNVDAAGDLDQFRHPADPGDQGIVPLFKEEFWMAGQRRGTCARFRQPRFHVAHQRRGLCIGADNRADHPHHIENAEMVR